MKKIALAFVGLVMLGLYSCNKEEITAIENNLAAMQDSLDVVIAQYNSLVDSISFLIETVEAESDIDLNAIRMSQIGILFESIARQPEAAGQMINATKLLYDDYTELLPFSDNAILERGEALSELFDALARNPMSFDMLDSAATRFLGAFDPLGMSSDLVEGTARGSAFLGLFWGLSRNPYYYGKIDSAATKFLGVYDSNIFSEQLINTSMAYAYEGLVGGLARQPEADSLFNLICEDFFNYSFMDD